MNCAFFCPLWTLIILGVRWSTCWWCAARGKCWRRWRAENRSLNPSNIHHRPVRKGRESGGIPPPLGQKERKNSIGSPLIHFFGENLVQYFSKYSSFRSQKWQILVPSTFVAKNIIIFAPPALKIKMQFLRKWQNFVHFAPYIIDFSHFHSRIFLRNSLLKPDNFPNQLCNSIYCR